MKVAVWDTYVIRTDKKVMHFDILVPSELKDERTIFNFGKEYLLSKKQGGQLISANECQFCHIEEASPEVIESIRQKGYFIIEMQNCN